MEAFECIGQIAHEWVRASRKNVSPGVTPVGWQGKTGEYEWLHGIARTCDEFGSLVTPDDGNPPVFVGWDDLFVVAPIPAGGQPTDQGVPYTKGPHDPAAWSYAGTCAYDVGHAVVAWCGSEPEVLCRGVIVSVRDSCFTIRVCGDRYGRPAPTTVQPFEMVHESRAYGYAGTTAGIQKWHDEIANRLREELQAMSDPATEASADLAQDDEKRQQIAADAALIADKARAAGWVAKRRRVRKKDEGQRVARVELSHPSRGELVVSVCDRLPGGPVRRGTMYHVVGLPGSMENCERWFASMQAAPGAKPRALDKLRIEAERHGAGYLASVTAGMATARLAD